MILPKNGRVIIIDDEPAQAIPLISALSKYNVSSTYFDAKKETLPVSTFSDVRVMFLDINLNGGQQPNWETEKSMISNNIRSIINPHTPYILFVWSVNETDHFDDLVLLFNEGLVDYKPIAPLIKMSKTELFEQNIDDTGRSSWTPTKTTEEMIEFINLKLITGISTIDSLEVLFKWENIVADSTTETTNEIISLAQGKLDINIELKNIYFKLAEAMWGRQITKDPYEISKKAVSVLSELLNDKLHSKINQNLDFSIVKDINPPETFMEIDKAIFNSKLLLNQNLKAESFPGNVYEVVAEKIEEFPNKGLIADSLNIPLVSSEFFELKNGKKADSINQIIEFKSDNRKEYEKYEKSIRVKIKPMARFLKLELSPMCDFAQKKWKVNRVCPAILWHISLGQYIGKSENLYTSPILKINDECYYLVVDLRYFSSIHLDELKDVQPIFGLKHSFLTEIQSILSRHVNRPGITSLN
jgi:hypothetical protein